MIMRNNAGIFITNYLNLKDIRANIFKADMI
jgi:hypothetical protein